MVIIAMHSIVSEVCVNNNALLVQTVYIVLEMRLQFYMA